MHRHFIKGNMLMTNKYMKKVFNIPSYWKTTN